MMKIFCIIIQYLLQIQYQPECLSGNLNAFLLIQLINILKLKFIPSKHIQRKNKIYKACILLKRLFNNQTNMQSVKITQKKQLLLPCEIDGEEKYCLKTCVNRQPLKISQFQDLQVQEKLKQPDAWLKQQIHHLFELKLQNLHKQVMQAKMQTPLFKISKISLGQIHKLRQQLKKQHIAKYQNMIYQEIADILLGKDFSDRKIRQAKIHDLKAGRYNNLTVSVSPLDFAITLDTQINKIMQTTIQQLVFVLLQLHRDKQYIQQRNINYEKQAIKNVEQNGIVFLDQIDKLTSDDIFHQKMSVSREGVQRDLLPLIQGTIVNTKIGDVNTENILFIACGAFSMSKVQNLMPQFLGRLPIRINMAPISQQQFIRILKQPKYNLLLQQSKMLQQENITLQYTPESIQQIAKYAYDANMYHENLGARRLHQVTEKIIQDVSFNCPDYKGQVITIDANYVVQKLKDMTQKMDLNKFLI